MVIGKVFPQAVIKRMDADAMARKDAFRETLHAFRAGKIDILIGTQMIAKGLHFPNVTLVGIINADLALHLPDFRAGERTFQLLTQVAGPGGARRDGGRGVCAELHAVQSRRSSSPGTTISRATGSRRWISAPSAPFPPFVQSGAHHGKVRAPGARPVHDRNPWPADWARACPRACPWANRCPRRWKSSRVSSVSRSSCAGRSAFRLSRHVKAVLAKLQMPVDVTTAVDVDPYQLL